MKYFFTGFADRYTVRYDWDEIGATREPDVHSVIEARERLNKKSLRHEKGVPSEYLEKISGYPIRDCLVTDEDGEVIIMIDHEPKTILN